MPRARFPLYGQDPRHDLEPWGSKVHFGTAGAAVHMVDLKTREYRESLLQDLYDAARIVDALDHIHFFQRTLVPATWWARWSWTSTRSMPASPGTTKHVGTSFCRGDTLNAGLEILHLVAGGEAAWRARPFVSLSCCFVVPPLRFAEDACRGLEVAVAGGMPVLLLSAGQAGATSPAALAGSVVQAVAEVLAGLCYVNALKPGAPAIFGTWPFVSDLRTGAMSGGSAEQALLMAACAQMGQFYDLPTGVASGMSDSKLPDAQSGAEKGYNHALVGNAGANLIYEAAGMQASLLGFSHESLVIDNDIIGASLRTIRGIEVNDAALSFETMRQVCLEGPGHYLGSQQTLALMQRDYFYPAGRRPLEPEGVGGAGPDRHRPAGVGQGRGAPGRPLPRPSRRRRRPDPRPVPDPPARGRHAPGGPRGNRGMTRTARVVVIGGGAVGCSALYHLALRGWTDCLLLEMNELTSGSTWHAAGNCPTFSGSWTVMKMQAYGAKLYRRLSAELEGGIGYHGTGSLRLAHHRERMDEFRHVLAMARAQGLAFDLLSPTQARELYPFLETHDLEGALWDPMDGDVDPSQLTQAYARLAREAGCRIERFTRVTSLARGSSGEWLVGTDKGETIRAEIVVNAAGYRAGEIMALLGQHMPIVSMQHQYLVTEDIPALVERGQDRLPLLRDPDVSYYLRQERQGFILGPYEWQCRAEWQRRHPGRLRLPALARRSGPPGALYRGRLRPRADPGRGRRQARGQRPDPLRAGRQSLYRPGAWADQLLPVLLLQLRHRPVGRGRQVPERVGGRRRPGMGRLGVRPAPLHRLRHHLLHGRQGGRAVPERIRGRLPVRGAPGRAARRGRRRSIPC